MFITNMTEQPQRYHLIVRHETGSWLPGLRTIAPHETQVVDIATLQRDQTTDAKGHIIPASARNGQVHWSVVRAPGGPVTDPKGLVGRMEHVDLAHDIDSTYACTYFGDDYYLDSGIDPSSRDIGIDDITGFSAWEEDSNYYGDSIDGQYDVTGDLDWTAGDTNIAMSFGGGSFQGIANGMTYAHGSGTSMNPEEPQEQIDVYGDLTVEYCPGDSTKSTMIQEYKGEGANVTLAGGGLDSVVLTSPPAAAVLTSNGLRWSTPMTILTAPTELSWRDC